MGERAVATKKSQTSKEPKIKLFLSDVFAGGEESVEDSVNKWFISNAGKVKVYDIVCQRPNIASRDDGISCIGIVYSER